jgi:hypothetical protein
LEYAEIQPLKLYLNSLEATFTFTSSCSFLAPVPGTGFEPKTNQKDQGCQILFQMMDY